MQIYNSKEDLRVVVRTPSAAVIDCAVTELEVEGPGGPLLIVAGAEPTLLGLAGTDLRLRKRDGTVIGVSVDWGSLVAVGRQARVVAHNAVIRYLEPLRLVS
jgi:F0F1-type ATP synthase epsilon subunit